MRRLTQKNKREKKCLRLKQSETIVTLLFSFCPSLQMISSVNIVQEVIFMIFITSINYKLLEYCSWKHCTTLFCSDQSQGHKLSAVGLGERAEKANGF